MNHTEYNGRGLIITIIIIHDDDDDDDVYIINNNKKFETNIYTHYCIFRLIVLILLSVITYH